MAKGSAAPTPGNDKGAKLDKPMPNGNVRMSPASPSSPKQPVRH